jgi:hypothetical protein
MWRRFWVYLLWRFWRGGRDDESQHLLLDSALAPGPAVAIAGPVFIPNWTMVGERQPSPLGRPSVGGLVFLTALAKLRLLLSLV